MSAAAAAMPFVESARYEPPVDENCLTRNPLRVWGYQEPDERNNVVDLA
jgi:hypothetical protein